MKRQRANGVGLAVLALALGLLAPAGAVSAPSVPPLFPPTYPDLVPKVGDVRIDRPNLGFDPATGAIIYGPLSLYFDTWSQNLGEVPIDLVVEDPDVLARTTVSQCVSWATDFVCLQRALVGGFVWHEPHTHFHLEDFARYELRRLRPNGRVDYSDRGLLGLSEKVSFCLMDTVPVRADAFPAQRYTTCTPAQQGISPGWTDIYYSGLPGQQLPIEGLADGRYAVTISLNTAGNLYESAYDNNRVEAVVELSNGLTQATVMEQRLS